MDSRSAIRDAQIIQFILSIDKASGRPRNVFFFKYNLLNVADCIKSVSLVIKKEMR